MVPTVALLRQPLLKRIETNQMKKRLARTTDPATSKAAADRVDLTLTDNHMRVLKVLRGLRVATDDQIADAAVNAKIVSRHEQARRLLRTVRDRTTFIQPALNDVGQQLTLENDSGRQALAWCLSDTGRVAVRRVRRGV